MNPVKRDYLAVRAAMCTGKEKFDRATANRVARRRQRVEKALQSFKCRICGYWHLGVKRSGS